MTFVTPHKWCRGRESNSHDLATAGFCPPRSIPNSGLLPGSPCAPRYKFCLTCRWWDSNPHTFRYTILSRACIPISPHRQNYYGVNLPIPPPRHHLCGVNLPARPVSNRFGVGFHRGGEHCSPPRCVRSVANVDHTVNQTSP